MDKDRDSIAFIYEGSHNVDNCTEEEKTSIIA